MARKMWQLWPYHRFIKVGLYSLILLGLMALPATGQKNQRVIKRIQEGKISTNTKVEISGYIDQWQSNPSGNTWAYKIRDDWGDDLTVVTDRGLPPTAARYRVTGIVNFDRSRSSYVLTELSRSEKDGNGAANALLPILVLAVIGVGALLLMVLRRPQKTKESEFESDAVVAAVDKNKHVFAAVPRGKAIENGTIGILSGNFEVKGGGEIKEILLVLPSGANPNQIDYTIGRLPGEKFRHIQLNEPTVSSQQAILKHRNKEYTFINIPDPDDSGRNASLINGVPMKSHESHVLKDGDVIRMGTVDLVWHSSRDNSSA